MDCRMDIYWLEQTESQVPHGNDWLSTAEAEVLRGLRFAKRRADWRLGRWTAKNAVAMRFGAQLEPAGLHNIEIRPAASGAPEVFFEGERAPLSISLSHRAGFGACAVGTPGMALGCDLEFVEPHSATFAADYFSVEEQELVARHGLSLAQIGFRRKIQANFRGMARQEFGRLHDALRAGLGLRGLTVHRVRRGVWNAHAG